LRPLHKAAMSGDVRTVQRLLKQDAFPNARANDGRTPLSIATAGNARQVINALKAVGATLEGVPAEPVPPPGE
jgi:ankyrin repeat protein